MTSGRGKEAGYFEQHERERTQRLRFGSKWRDSSIMIDINADIIAIRSTYA